MEDNRVIDFSVSEVTGTGLSMDQMTLAEIFIAAIAKNHTQ